MYCLVLNDDINCASKGCEQHCRAYRAKDSSGWTPRDALIQALRDLDSGEIAPTMLIVAHVEVNSDGGQKVGSYNAVANTFECIGILECAKCTLIENTGG